MDDKAHKILKEAQIGWFKEDYPNYREAFTDQQVDEIIGYYVYMLPSSYNDTYVKYNELAREGKIDKEWFEIIKEYCVLNQKITRRNFPYKNRH